MSLPWATFVIVSEQGVVIEAAPIARWCIGKRMTDVVSYFANRGATLVELRLSDV